MKDIHPHLKFQCGVCDILYSTYNAAYRHTQRHFKLRYECDQCEHKSQFPHQLRSHKRIHTRKHLLPCTWRGCTKKFTSKRSMWQHLQAHSPDKWNCNKCDPPKTFETKSNFRQHEKGAHGLGWRSYCGKLHPWPSVRTSHQKECQKCIDIKNDRKALPENPRPFKRRKIVKLTDTDGTSEQ